MFDKPRFSAVLAAVLAGILVALTLTGCPASLNPSAAAQAATPDNYALTQAYASYGEWTIFHEQVAELLCGPATPTSKCPGNPAIPQDAVKRVQTMDDRATRVEPHLLRSITLVQTIQAQLAKGETPAEKLEIANANLVKWSTELQRILTDMKLATGR